MQVLFSTIDCRLFSLIVMHFVSATHFPCRMSQEYTGEDRLEQDIQGYKEEITRVQAQLDAARNHSPRDEASITVKDLKEDLAELRKLVQDLRVMQARVGIDSDTQSKYCMAGCVHCLCIVCVEGLRVGLRR